MQACQPGQPACLASPQTVPQATQLMTSKPGKSSRHASNQYKPVLARLLLFPAYLAPFFARFAIILLPLYARVQDGINSVDRSLVRARTRRYEKLQPKHVRKSDSKTCQIETENRLPASPKIRRTRCSKIRPSELRKLPAW